MSDLPCSCQINLLKMARVVFLLPTLLFHLLLHLAVAEATTGKGENCPNCDFYLKLNLTQTNFKLAQ